MTELKEVTSIADLLGSAVPIDLTNLSSDKPLSERKGELLKVRFDVSLVLSLCANQISFGSRDDMVESAIRDVEADAAILTGMINTFLWFGKFPADICSVYERFAGSATHLCGLLNPYLIDSMESSLVAE